MGYGAGAHGAGLQRDPQIASLEPFTTANIHRRAKRQHFSVVKAVTVPLHPVLRQRDDVAARTSDCSSHRHLAGGGSRSGLLQQKRHDIDVL